MHRSKHIIFAVLGGRLSLPQGIIGGSLDSIGERCRMRSQGSSLGKDGPKFSLPESPHIAAVANGVGLLSATKADLRCVHIDVEKWFPTLSINLTWWG